MESKKSCVHLINELPHIYELEDMMEFCKRHKRLYIYGRGENQEYLLKYFDMCGVKIDGYAVSFMRGEEPFVYRGLPVRLAEEVLGQEGAGLLLALSDRYFGAVIPMLRRHQFQDYFILSEYNKRAIAHQMKPRPREALTFEVSLADHCNLSCQMCDHYSQLAGEWCVAVERFEKDMIRMGEIFEHKIAAITLLGGEPTLHKDIIECLRITRREFPETELIVMTNGTLLLDLEHSPQGNFWEACRTYQVHISVTVYPVNLNYPAMEEKAREYGVPIFMSSNIHSGKPETVKKISDKHTMNLEGKAEKCFSISCLYYNKFNVLKEGRLYMCPIAAHSDIFNRAFHQELKLREEDSLDIYKIGSWKDISEFTSRCVPFCGYCDLKRWGHASEWRASSKKIEEYIDTGRSADGGDQVK